MIITIPWLKEHLKTTAKESEIINQLTNIGLEVEGVTENSGDIDIIITNKKVVWNTLSTLLAKVSLKGPMTS